MPPRTSVTRRQLLLALAGAGAAGGIAAGLHGNLNDLGETETRVKSVHRKLSKRAVFGINHLLSDSEPINGSLLHLENVLQYDFPVVGNYLSFDSVWSLTKHPSIAQIRRSQQSLMVAWMPQSAFHVVNLADISAGLFDNYIDQMILGMRRFEKPIVVRFGHEMNGSWYPWSVAYTRSGKPNGGCSSASSFVSAWRYIVSRERGIPGRSNIRWMWCPNVQDVGVIGAGGTDIPGGKAVAAEAYWPGAEWVDIIGMDGYNEPTSWQSFDEIFRRPYRRFGALSLGAPVWVGETGCHEPIEGQEGSKALWLEGMFASRRFPRMEAVCYFDYDASNAGRADWSLGSSSRSIAAAKRLYSETQPIVYRI